MEKQNYNSLTVAFTRFITRRRTRISQVWAVAFLFFFAFSEKKLLAGTHIMYAVMFCGGWVLVGIATVGRIWCAQYIAGQKAAALVTEGPYSITRNPLYLFSLLGGTGVGLFTESLTLTAIIIASFAALYPIVIRSEERNLLIVFGQSYREYMANVPRFFPKLTLFREPPSCLVNTRVFRREIFDAVFFIWIVGVLKIIGQLAKCGVIKTFVSIY